MDNIYMSAKERLDSVAIQRDMREVVDTVKTASQQLLARGSEVSQQVQSLMREGLNYRLIVRNRAGQTMLQVPLTVGVIGGLSFVFLVMPKLLSPPTAFFLAARALFSRMSFIIEEDDTHMQGEVKFITPT